jgi:hypothetical protein
MLYPTKGPTLQGSGVPVARWSSVACGSAGAMAIGVGRVTIRPFLARPGERTNDDPRKKVPHPIHAPGGARPADRGPRPGGFVRDAPARLRRQRDAHRAPGQTRLIHPFDSMSVLSAPTGLARSYSPNSASETLSTFASRASGPVTLPRGRRPAELAPTSPWPLDFVCALCHSLPPLQPSLPWQIRRGSRGHPGRPSPWLRAGAPRLWTLSNAPRLPRPKSGSLQTRVFLSIP